jgi:hypothetical protein
MFTSNGDEMKLQFILIIKIIFTINLLSQTTANPDISAIGIFNTTTNFTEDDPGYGKIIFNTPELELYFEGYLNPFARATFNIAVHDGHFEAEEIYANIVRGLPLDLQLKAGKFLVGFGKINTIHPHGWSFLQRPLFQQIYFGEEGFNDIGLTLSLLLPTGDVFTNLDLGVFKGDVFSPSHEDESAEHEDEPGRGNSPIFNGRLNSFFSISDYSSMEIGLSSSYGIYNREYFNITGDTSSLPVLTSLNYHYAGIDFKYKYRPNSYTALIIQAEGIWNSRNIGEEGTMGVNSIIENKKRINTFGFFVYTDYRFNKIFSVGAKYDYTNGIIGDELSHHTLANDDDNNTQGIEGWIGYYPVEETLALRLGVQNLWFNYSEAIERPSETKVVLQLIFSLGPHKAHPF